MRNEVRSKPLNLNKCLILFPDKPTIQLRMYYIVVWDLIL